MEFGPKYLKSFKRWELLLKYGLCSQRDFFFLSKLVPNEKVDTFSDWRQELFELSPLTVYPFRNTKKCCCHSVKGDMFAGWELITVVKSLDIYFVFAPRGTEAIPKSIHMMTWCKNLKHLLCDPIIWRCENTMIMTGKVTMVLLCLLDSL